MNDCFLYNMVRDRSDLSFNMIEMSLFAICEFTFIFHDLWWNLISFLSFYAKPCRFVFEACTLDQKHKQAKSICSDFLTNFSSSKLQFSMFGDEQFTNLQNYPGFLFLFLNLIFFRLNGNVKVSRFCSSCEEHVTIISG